MGSGLSSQIASSSQVSSLVSPNSASGASGLTGSQSKPGEVSTLTGPALSSLVPPLFSLEMLSQGLGSLAPTLDVVCDSSGVLCSSQQASLGQAKFPQPGKAGCGSAFPSVSSRVVEFGKQLRLSLPVMTECGVPIYPSKSKSVMRYSRKRKDAQLNKFLIVESLAAITTSPSPLGFHHSPPSVAVREPPVSFCRHGFLLLHNHSSPPLEVGESSRRGVSEEVVGSSVAGFDASLCL